MKMKYLLLSLFFVCLTCQHQLIAQEVPPQREEYKHELGLNFGSVLNAIAVRSEQSYAISDTKYVLFYRKRKGNKAKRIRLGGSIVLRGSKWINNDQTIVQGRLNFYSAFGWDRIVPVSTKPSLNYGLEILADMIVGGSSNNNSQSNTIRLVTGLQFPVGLQYHITERFNLGFEAGVFSDISYQRLLNNNEKQARMEFNVGYSPMTMFYASFEF